MSSIHNPARGYWSQRNAPWPAILQVPEGHVVTVHHPASGETTEHTHTDDGSILPQHSFITAVRKTDVNPNSSNDGNGSEKTDAERL
jgi:hypothetical protein